MLKPLTERKDEEFYTLMELYVYTKLQDQKSGVPVLQINLASLINRKKFHV